MWQPKSSFGPPHQEASLERRSPWGNAAISAEAMSFVEFQSDSVPLVHQVLFKSLVHFLCAMNRCLLRANVFESNPWSMEYRLEHAFIIGGDL